MQIRNLIEFTVDMTNKQDEIVQIINVYLSQIQDKDAKRQLLEHIALKVDQALETYIEGE